MAHENVSVHKQLHYCMDTSIQLHIVFGCFLATIAELSNYKKHSRSPKASSIYHSTLCRKKRKKTSDFSSLRNNVLERF